MSDFPILEQKISNERINSFEKILQRFNFNSEDSIEFIIPTIRKNYLEEFMRGGVQCLYARIDF